MAKKKRRRRTPSKIEVEQLRAQAIVLVDEYGTARAEFSTAGDVTMLRLLGDDSVPVLELVHSKGGPSIRLHGGGLGVSIAVNAGRGCGMMINDAEGSGVISMGVPDPAGSSDPRGPHPQIDVFDKTGGLVWNVWDGAMPTTAVEKHPTADSPGSMPKKSG